MEANKKPYHLMTKAEQLADRIQKNRETEERMKYVPTNVRTMKTVPSGAGTRREVGASGSSFLFKTERGVF